MWHVTIYHGEAWAWSLITVRKIQHADGFGGCSGGCDGSACVILSGNVIWKKNKLWINKRSKQIDFLKTTRASTFLNSINKFYISSFNFKLHFFYLSPRKVSPVAWLTRMSALPFPADKASYDEVLNVRAWLLLDTVQSRN